ncbi:phage integrase family protein [Paraburkholderia sp. BL23I1N1]|uniref:site-specific integrase n=1 Tax=Paraburkholderia sp. BL23I1N1 TaxID=1938802 RepID=UPI000FED9A25|nr:site-specific integrase [Paraburkholderia sp. BL23I1N1]RKE25872.1 phage integrase family protein [Paraburkholderia sp. BL23I1N1]
MNSLAQSTTSELPGPIDVAGHDNDVEGTLSLPQFSGDVWRLDAQTIINWNLLAPAGPTVVTALRKFVAYVFVNRSAATARGYFRSLCLIFKEATAINIDASDLGAYDITLFHQLRIQMSSKYAVSTIAWSLHAFRSWYVWCTEAEIDGFDFDIAVVLDSLVIGGGPKGEAVLGHDPNVGPLHPAEFDRLFLALRKATQDEAIQDQDLAVAWLFVAFGCNPKNLYLLHDEDLLKTKMADGTTEYELRIPRIKKPGVAERSQFRTRPLRLDIGILLERVVRWNAGARALVQAAALERQFTTPMFRRGESREELIGTQFETQAYRWRTVDFNRALARVVRKLNLTSNNGEPLMLTPRRLRYTFATRLVQDGASPAILADALDHTDLQHVMVYYNARSDIVVKLDLHVAMKLAPYAQSFMGVVVQREADATRGSDPASRVKHFDKDHGKLSDLGSCGSFGFCGLAAPIACYTCARFQAWLEAPHEEVLNALLADRDAHLQRGADPKMTQARDLTITAVATVVQLCKRMKEADTNA